MVGFKTCLDKCPKVLIHFLTPNMESHVTTEASFRKLEHGAGIVELVQERRRQEWSWCRASVQGFGVGFGCRGQA